MSGTAPASTRSQRALDALRRHRKWISVVVALGCAALVARALTGQDWPAVIANVRSADPGRVAVASLLVIASFLALTAYDFVAIRLAGFRTPPAGLVMRASFVGFVMAMNFGFSALSGGAVRAWYYGRAGIPAGGIVLVIAHMAATFFIGWLGLFGATLMFWPVEALTEHLGWVAAVQRLFGAGILLALAAYFAACFAGARPRVGRFQWQLPAPGLALTQAGVSLVDACIAGLVLYYLLSGAGVAFPVFMRSFLAAVFLGMASQVPGGFGVIEVTLMKLLPAVHPPEFVLGAMIQYRLLNFVAPLAIAGAIFLFDVLRASRARN